MSLVSQLLSPASHLLSKVFLTIYFTINAVYTLYNNNTLTIFYRLTQHPVRIIRKGGKTLEEAKTTTQRGTTDR